MVDSKFACEKKRINKGTFMKPITKVFTTIIFAALTAIEFTACQDNRECTYDANKNTLSCPEKTYKTVNLGNKIWMAENLDVFTPDSSVCYGNQHDNCNTDGRLYTYASSIGAVCPTGWDLPTKQDFETTFATNAPATFKDSAGFNAVFAGFKYYDGNFADKGASASFWTKDSYDDSRAYLLRITDTSVTYEHFNKNIFASVRCIKK